ncbi:MAG: secondary thiamine-phosphate synthase enzyme YjbQ [candidate division Zixibacteria bacterium]|nr:secondary thiamine-phosphate synthase enzyme YjbQ [candidate division Zixibacteria bacterium]
MIKEISIRTSSRVELVDITSKVEEVISASKVESGICIIFVPHTTAAVTINENADPSVQRDILYELNKLVPFNDNYSHTEGNSAAHIKSSIIGASRSIIIQDGSLKLGTWQGIYFCEFDGPRNRKVWIKIIKDE